MKTETFERAGSQIKSNLSDIAETARDISEKVKDGWDDARRDVRHAVRRAKEVTDEGVTEARHRIKENPLTSVAVVAAGAFTLGLVTGWLIARRRD